MFDKDVPGPGKYNYLKSFGADAHRFSISCKLDNKNKKKATCPGPGEYPIVSINPNGKYPLSGMRNATSIVFGANKGERFNYQRNDKFNFLR
jgi:hypothetical protein